MAGRYAPWYCYEQTDYSGNMWIFNGYVNYFYDDDGHYSSVSGNGAVLNGGKGNDSIWNGYYENYGGDRVKIFGGAGNDKINLERLTVDELTKISLKAFALVTFKIVSEKVISDIISNKLLKGMPIATGGLDWLLALGENAPGIYGYPFKIANAAKDVYGAIKDFNKYKYYFADKSTSTVADGAGDDTIIVDGIAPRVFEYSDGDGNDVYYRFNDNTFNVDDFELSTLRIKKGRIKHVSVIGNDVTLVVGKGSIKLVNGANKKFKLIDDEEGGTVTTRAYGLNLDTGKVVCSIFGSAQNDNLQDKVGIEFAATSSTVTAISSSTQKTIGTIFDHVIYGYDGRDTLSGNDKDDTIHGGDGSDKIFGEGGNDVLYGEGGNDTIAVHGMKISVNGGTGNDSIQLGYVAPTDNVSSTVTVDAGANNDTIRSYISYVTLTGGAVNDVISLSADAKKNYIRYASGDGFDTISGLDDDDTLKITSGTVDTVTVAGSDVILTVGDGNDHIYGAGTVRILGASYSTLRNGNDLILAVGDYSGLKPATQMLNGTVKLIGGQKYFKIEGTCSGQYTPEGLSKDDADIKVSADFAGNEINLANFDGVKNIDASTSTKKLSLGGSKANTLNGGKGNDTFIYTAGKDVITDYAVGHKIKFGGAITSTKLSGNSVVFSVGKGKLTVNNAKGKKLALIDSAGKSLTATISDVMTVTNKTASPVTVAPYVKTVDASKRTKSVMITGNASANSIVGGKGADTLLGGTGNDSLWGGAGSDTFTASYNSSKKEVAFKVGKGSVTLRDFNTTTFQVNDTTYQLSGGKLKIK